MCSKYDKSALKEETPLIKIWDQYDCTGNYLTIPPADNDLPIWSPNPKKRSIIPQSMWVPPNISIGAYRGYHLDLTNVDPTQRLVYEPERGMQKYDGSKTRIYSRITQYPIDILKIRAIRPITEQRLQCCKGNSPLRGVSKAQCGAYWRSASEGGSGACDAIMDQYCQKFPDAKICSCYSRPSNPTDTDLVKQLKSKPYCYCNKCLMHGYKPSTIRGYKCPNIKICQQDINFAGSENVVMGNIISMDCSTDVITGLPAPVSGEMLPVPPSQKPDVDYGLDAGGLGAKSAEFVKMIEQFVGINFVWFMMIMIFLITLIVFSICSKSARKLRVLTSH